MVLKIQLLVFGPACLAESAGQFQVEGRRYLGLGPQRVRQVGYIVVASVVGNPEKLQPAHVHGLLAFFQPEKNLINRAQSFHDGHSFCFDYGSVVKS
jgi:hypothetical protein